MIRVVLLMGVSGAGKTTVGRELATTLGWAFEDADAYHSAASLAKMARGEGLTDADRAPWLRHLASLVRQRIQDGPPTVLACSALKASYREQLHADDPAVLLVWLDASYELLDARLRQREAHVVGPQLLPSQLEALDPPMDAWRLDASHPISVLVGQIQGALVSHETRASSDLERDRREV